MAVWTPTDWTEIIETHRQALKAVLASLVALAACLGGGPTLPRHLHRAVLRLLRPAESAARRLVIVVARRLPMPPLPPLRPLPPRPAPLPAFFGPVVRVNLGLAVGPPPPKRPTRRHAPENGRAPRPPLFQILDPLRRVRLRRYPVRNGIPQIWVPGVTERLRAAPRRFDDPLDGAGIGRRLAALTAALDDLPGQARRFALWEQRNARDRAAGRRRRLWPLRAGPPPGQNKRRTHEVHDLLARLHSLADYALERRDTS